MSELINQDVVISERLAYVDFKLRFTGHISRADLKNTFGIAEAAASRVLTEYSKKRGKNKTQKANTILRNDFEPLISINAEIALGMLANGFNGNKLYGKTELAYEKIGTVSNYLEIEDVAKITRAIAGGYAINCNYMSENSKKHGVRTLVPHAIMYDGTSWMFRAYDRSEDKDNKFKNFNFRRALSVEEGYLDKDLRQREFETASSDKHWNLRVPMMLKLVDSLSDDKKKQIRVDFGMDPNANDLLMTERAAFRWILQKKWYIDARSETQKNEDKNACINRFYKFELNNLDMIKQLESL